MRVKILSGILLLISLSTGEIIAQDTDPIPGQDSLVYRWQRFAINLGGFLTTMNSDISLMGTNVGLGINVNLEDALGLSSTTFAIRGEADYNFGSRRRSHVRLGYFGLLRNSSKILESEITIGEETYPIGTEVNTRFDMHIIRGIYHYSFFRDERVNLALSAGFYVLPVSFSIGTDMLIDESANIIAPLPVVGIRNSLLVTPKFQIKQNMEVLYVRTSNFQGSINDLNIWLEYNPFRHWGFGLGYNTFRFYFSTSQELNDTFDFEGSIKTSFSGLLLYGKYFF